MGPCGPETMYCNHKVEPSQMSAHSIKDKLCIYISMGANKPTTFNNVDKCHLQNTDE